MLSVFVHRCIFKLWTCLQAHATGSTNHCTADAAVILATLGTSPACTVIKSLAQDAVMGGCLLSAAELDSSKQYIQVADVWTIAYQVD